MSMNVRTGVPLAVTALGEPRARATWSGTPANLCTALEQAGRLGAIYNTEGWLPRWLNRVVRGLARAWYAGSWESSRGTLPWRVREQGLRRFLAQARPAAVLHTGTLALPVAPASLRRYPARHFLFTDCTWHTWLELATTRPRYGARLVAAAERLQRAALAQMEHIFVTGRYVQEDLLTHYGVAAQKITVVGTGRGGLEPYFGPKDYAAGPVLFVAKERFQDKGGELLLAGFLQARARRPELRLVLAGHPDYPALAARYPGVEGHGFVTLAQLQKFFAEGALFALPAYSEPWGLVYLEALACRMPLLGLTRNAFPELAGDGRFGWAVLEPTPEAVAEALLAAVADPTRLAAMGEAGQKQVLEHFTWEATVARVLAVVDAAQG